MKYVDRNTVTPLCAVSTRSSLENKTGSWRFARPLFVDRVSPCNRQCPAGEDIAGTLYLAGQGRYEDAWRLIMQENPFPAVMGRVCYHTCEHMCNRAEHDEPVSVHTVERFLGDAALERGLRVDAPFEGSGRSVGVLGAGPAGLAAAYFSRLLGHEVVVYEAMERPGGLMRYGIPAYRLPRDVLDGEIDRIREMGVGFRMGQALGRDLTLETLTAAHDALFLAVGAHREFPLGVEGETLEGVFRALPFLKGISGGEPSGAGDRVAVVGGGNSAVDCARVCRRLGADVTVFYRRSEAEMPAHPEEVAAAREEGVAFEFLSAPEKVRGSDRVTAMRLARMRLGKPDASGRRSPEPAGEFFEEECTGVILATGESPDLGLFPEAVRGEKGTIEADAFGRTPLDKVFAGGDLAPVPRTVTHAIGSGKRAAAAIHAFLNGEDAAGDLSLSMPGDPGLFPRRNPDPEVAGYEALNPFYFDHRPAFQPEEVPASRRLAGFREVVRGAPEDAVRAEALRCFNCGSCTACGNCYLFCPDVSIRKDPQGFGYVVDLDYCKGCGICVQECPRGAMILSFAE